MIISSALGASLGSLGRDQLSVRGLDSVRVQVRLSDQSLTEELSSTDAAADCFVCVPFFQTRVVAFSLVCTSVCVHYD